MSPPDNASPWSPGQRLRAPFPWFGGNSRVADIVWARFGDVPNSVEPFAGSLAVLLARPHPPRTETVNDADAYIANFWRATQADPDAVARWADWPVHEADLHARHRWLVTTGAERLQRLLTDPDYYDAQVAGWWVWGIGIWIGGGWCRAAATGGRGLYRNRPHLGNKGQGVHASSFGSAPMGCDERSAAIRAFMRALRDRLRHVRVCCGDWTRVLGPTPTVLQGTTAVFLDPPYPHAERDPRCYAVNADVFERVRAWAIAHGDDPRLRIALCGYEDGRAMPDGWTTVRWQASGGYTRGSKGRGRQNARRERIWFSPYCLRPPEAAVQPGLLDRETDDASPPWDRGVSESPRGSAD